MRERGGPWIGLHQTNSFTYALVEVDRILPRNDVGDGGAGGGGFFGSWLGGSFRRHGCCKLWKERGLVGRPGGGKGDLKEWIESVVCRRS